MLELKGQPVLFVSACSDHNWRPDKSGPMALNQFRPSVPLWSETLWPTFIKHVAISAQLILQIFTSYSYDKFRQLKKSINYTLSSSELNGLYKKSPCLPISGINFKIAITRFAKVYNYGRNIRNNILTLTTYSLSAISIKTN